MRSLGLVNIFFDGNEKDTYIEKVSSGEFPSPPGFTVQFQARSTFWRYFVVSRYSGALKHLAINSVDETLSFTEPKAVRLTNGEEAYMFECEQELPLRERSPVNFQLRKNRGGNSDKVVLNRMPVPSIEMIKPDSREAGAKIFSEVIIYI
jgi:hypothetical protein